MNDNMRDHCRRVCAGLIRKYMSRPKRPLATVTKSIETIARRQGVLPADLAEELQEIRQLSVDPFGQERLARFDEITAELSQRGVT